MTPLSGRWRIVFYFGIIIPLIKIANDLTTMTVKLFFSFVYIFRTFSTNVKLDNLQTAYESVLAQKLCSKNVGLDKIIHIYFPVTN